MEENREPSKINENRMARISEVRKSGIVLTLDNGEYAWLPSNEIDSDDEREKPDLSKIFKEDEELEVKIIGESLTRDAKIVSQSKVRNDTWNKTENWEIGGVKRIKIKSTLLDRAFGIIGKESDGIDGVVKFKELDGLFSPKFPKEVATHLANIQPNAPYASS